MPLGAPSQTVPKSAWIAARRPSWRCSRPSSHRPAARRDGVFQALSAGKSGNGIAAVRDRGRAARQRRPRGLATAAIAPAGRCRRRDGEPWAAATTSGRIVAARPSAAVTTRARALAPAAAPMPASASVSLTAHTPVSARGGSGLSPGVDRSGYHAAARGRRAAATATAVPRSTSLPPLRHAPNRRRRPSRCSCRHPRVVASPVCSPRGSHDPRRHHLAVILFLSLLAAAILWRFAVAKGPHPTPSADAESRGRRCRHRRSRLQRHRISGGPQRSRRAGYAAVVASAGGGPCGGTDGAKMIVDTPLGERPRRLLSASGDGRQRSRE